MIYTRKTLFLAALFSSSASIGPPLHNKYLMSGISWGLVSVQRRKAAFSSDRQPLLAPNPADFIRHWNAMQSTPAASTTLRSPPAKPEFLAKSSDPPAPARHGYRPYCDV
jgi:hypothetical protein